MPEQRYSYIIVGAGLTGASAVQGIREADKNGSILLLGAEQDLPYDRPPLSKQLWTGAQAVEDITLHDKSYYTKSNVDLRLGVNVTRIDPAQHAINDAQGNTYHYQRLLLATGGTPKRLSIPGGELEGIYYYRTLRDYRRLRAAAAEGKSALVIGGGFIGSEMAAALRTNNLDVTMLFPSPWLVSRVFPEALARDLTDRYRARGIQVLAEDVPTSIERMGAGFSTRTRAGRHIQTDLIVVGIGITPNVSLATDARLATSNGVIVNEFLQTSDPDIYAAGDIALFPQVALDTRRIEHWDNAQAQGRHAGRNLAGANEPFRYIPFFFSDLFEFGYEAVGEIDSRLETFADWLEENKTGVIYYLDGSRLRGAMMCNVWNQVDAARALIRMARPVTAADLRGAIPLPDPAPSP